MKIIAKYKRFIVANFLPRPNKNISVFRVTDLKFLGRVGTHNSFSGKNILPFKMHKLYFFPENLKNYSFHR